MALFFKLLIILSVALIGAFIFKPKWLHYQQKPPSFFLVAAVSLGLFIMGFTGLGEIHYADSNRFSEVAAQGKLISSTDYEKNNRLPRCGPNGKPGRAGKSNDEKSPSGIRYSVRTPANYDPTIAHPLLMVYAPARKSRSETEDLTYLTQAATAAGFIVAYADHRNMEPEAIVELAEIPKSIQNKWCVDPNKVYLTGHSDGGTISMGIAFINGTKHIPKAIAPSAAGIRGADLQERSCPKPLPVMVMHSRRDNLFPGYGKETIKWWAKCNRCDTTTTFPIADEANCIAYKGCKDNIKTWYCEGDGTHPEWPGINGSIIRFLKE